MSHWSEAAQQSASRSMGTNTPDAAIKPCEDRDWEPLAEVTLLPDWTPQIEVLGDPGGEPGPGQEEGMSAQSAASSKSGSSV